MKKIAFFIDTLQVGGIEKVLVETLKNIDKKKFNIKLLITYNLEELEKLKTEIPKEIKIEYLLENNIFTYYKKKKVLGKMNKFEKVINETLSVLKKAYLIKKLKKVLKGMETIIDFDMTLAPFIKYIDIKSIVFCHFSPKNYNRGIKKRQVKLFKRLNNYSKIVVISEAMKKEMIELAPKLKEKIIRIYNSLNIIEIKRLADNINKLDEKLIKEQKYILAIGRLEETQKDFTTLIKSYAMISDSIDEQLYIIGDGRHRKDLIELIKNLGVENKVKFLGFKLNPYPFIKNASIFVHSSKFEGLPTVMLEALILKKLIIATDCPTGPKEILDFGKAGLLVKMGDVEELAKTMLYALKNDVYDRYKDGIEKGINKFDSKFVIKELEDIL